MSRNWASRKSDASRGSMPGGGVSVERSLSARASSRSLVMRARRCSVLSTASALAGASALGGVTPGTSAACASAALAKMSDRAAANAKNTSLILLPLGASATAFHGAAPHRTLGEYTCTIFLGLLARRGDPVKYIVFGPSQLEPQSAFCCQLRVVVSMLEPRLSGSDAA